MVHVAVLPQPIEGLIWREDKNLLIPNIGNDLI